MDEVQTEQLAEEPSERKLIEDYVSLYCIEQTLNDVVNDLVDQRPPNPYQELSRLLLSKTLSEILSITVQHVVCCGGYGAVHVAVQTNMDRFEAMMATPTKIDESGFQTFQDQQELLLEMLQGQDPREQAKIDQLLQRETSIDKYVAMAVSCACCKAGARHLNIPIYLHIANLAEEAMPSLPTLEIAVLNGLDKIRGRPFEAIYLVPGQTTDLRTAVEGIAKIQHNIIELLQEKKQLTLGSYQTPAIPLASDIGSTIRSALEVVQLAIQKAELPIKFRIGLDARLSSFALLNEETNSMIGYTSPSGAVFAGVDLVENYANLWQTFALYAIEDPFHAQDTIAYRALKLKIKDVCANLSSNDAETITAIGGDSTCLLEVVGDSAINNREDIDRFANEAVINTTQLQLDKFRTVTGLIQCRKRSKTAGWSVILGCSEITNDSVDNFLVDLAIGLNTGRVRLPGLYCLQSAVKLNKLMQYQQDIKELVFVGDVFRR